MIFCIPFDAVLQGNILHENLMIFCITFDAVLQGNILHENLMILAYLLMQCYRVIVCMKIWWFLNHLSRKKVWRKSIASLHRLTQDVWQTNPRHVGGPNLNFNLESTKDPINLIFCPTPWRWFWYSPGFNSPYCIFFFSSFFFTAATLKTYNISSQ